MSSKFTPPFQNATSQRHRDKSCNVYRTLSWCALIILFGFIAFTTYERSYNREPCGDDLLYQMVLDNNPLGTNLSHVHIVSGFRDAMESQYHQYFHQGGRVPVHIFVQMFAGAWGYKAFGIFNASLLVLTIFLFGWLTLPAVLRRDALCWILISIGFLYLFQSNGNIWYGIVGSMNYLYPITLVLGWLIIWKNIVSENFKSNFLIYSLIALFSFITGWSHEAYSLPLSGGAFLFLCFNRKKIDKRLWYLVAPLWLGTAVLVFAPGNFNRMGGQPSHYMMLIRAIKYFIKTWMLWVFVFAAIAGAASHRVKLKAFIKEHSIYFFTLICACALGCFVNTLAQSFNGISLYFAIPGYILLWKIFPRKDSSRWGELAISSVIFALMAVHQIRIVDTTKDLYTINHKFVEDYIDSPDGVMKIPQRNIPADVKPFVSDWYSHEVDWWIYQCFNLRYFNGKKPLTISK